jgi:hypothetical protein
VVLRDEIDHLEANASAARGQPARRQDRGLA